MDIALSTTLIILGLLPGIVFWNSYLSGKFPRQMHGMSTVTELALYIVFSVPINAVAIWIVGHDPRMLRLEILVAAVTGKAGEDVPGVAWSLRTTWQFTTMVYILVIVACYIGGSSLRRIVWAFRLDLRYSFLQMKHPWYYLLQGRLPGFPRQVIPYADILVEHPGAESSRLYRGLIAAFTPTEAGEIKELVLRDASRGKGRGKRFKWADIPGDHFILLGPNIHSINMHYLQAPLPAPKSRWRRAWLAVKALWRSFLFEEP